MDLALVKNSLISLIRALDEKSYIAKFMDEFYELPHSVQVSLLSWIADQCDKDDWGEWAKDDTLHIKVVRAILFYYSGREDLKQPSPDDLKKMLADYIKDSGWEKISLETDEFADELERL